MANKDIPDYMRGFDLQDDWGMTPVSKTPESTPSVDPKVVEDSKLEISKVKSDVGDIKLYGGEIIVEEENGMICTLVYTDGDCVEKLYLPKQADDENTNNNKINYNK